MLIRRDSNSEEEDKEDDDAINKNRKIESQSSQIEKLKSEVKKLKDELDSQSKDTELNIKNAGILHKLYKSGYIDEEGNMLD